MKDKETETFKPCPFCNKPPQAEDGCYYLVAHAPECFFTKHYAQEMWLVGNKEKAAWNTRPATLEDRALDALEYCVKTLALEFDYRPDEPDQWDAARALLREAGRVK